MNLENREFGPGSLLQFSQECISRYSETWPPSEEELAGDFACFFCLVRYFTPERLVNLCASLGIEVSFKNMPKCLTGAYGSLEGKTVIFICQEESFPGIKEHTIFHELREILEHSFKDLGFPSVTTGEELEKAAEDFAVQVRIALGRTVWTAMLEGTEKVESKLLRFVAFAFVVLGALVIEGSCALLPYFERVHSQSKT